MIFWGQAADLLFGFGCVTHLYVLFFMELLPKRRLAGELTRIFVYQSSQSAVIFIKKHCTVSILAKLVENIKIKDLEKFPVWQYINNDTIGETSVKPVKKIPVKSTDGKIFGVKVNLANGRVIWATLCNVVAGNSRLTDHFLLISLEYNDEWFTLARYYDFDYEQNGPKALADFLKMEVDEVFPISYDITPYVIGEKSALLGIILKDPKEKLTKPEIIALSIS